MGCHINEESDAFFLKALSFIWMATATCSKTVPSVSVSANFVTVLLLCLALQVERDIDPPKSIPRNRNPTLLSYQWQTHLEKPFSNTVKERERVRDRNVRETDSQAAVCATVHCKECCLKEMVVQEEISEC